jgi:hypothetical protein
LPKSSGKENDVSASSDDQGDARIQRLVEAGIIDPEYPRYHEVFAGLSDDEERILISIKKRCDQSDLAEDRALFAWRLPH